MANPYIKNRVTEEGRRGRLSLASGLEQLDLSPTLAAVLQRYIALLSKWNQRVNLIGPRELDRVVSLHIFDSLALVPYIGATRVLDVGSGAGLPGLVLALAMPASEFVLLDSRAKKVRFLQQAIVELNVTNATTTQSRVQDYLPAAPFSVVIARAFGSLQRLYTATSGVRGRRCSLFAMKGKWPHAEIAELGAGQRVKVVPLRVPGLDAERHLVIVAAK